MSLSLILTLIAASQIWAIVAAVLCVLLFIILFLVPTNVILAGFRMLMGLQSRIVGWFVRK